MRLECVSIGRYTQPFRKMVYVLNRICAQHMYCIILCFKHINCNIYDHFLQKKKIKFIFESSPCQTIRSFKVENVVYEKIRHKIRR